MVQMCSIAGPVNSSSSMSEGTLGQIPSWAGDERVLLRGGTVHAHGSPFATAMLVDGPTIAWVGDDAGAVMRMADADRIVDLDGALVAPGFVDAHVHATSTGMTLDGLDLSRTDSLDEALSLLSQAAKDRRGSVLIGHGWDETRWPERRPPTREELDRATWGSVVYLTRIDVHSAVVSSALIAMVPAVRDAEGFSSDGWVRRDAHHVIRTAVLSGIGAGVRDAAHDRIRAHAASLGIVAMHEMAGPVISDEADCAALLARSAATPGPLVYAYWGQLASEGGIEVAQRLGAVGAGGDLFIDGAIGSRTACMRDHYLDDATTGALYLTEDDVEAHLLACTQAQIQGGFHVIGDRATDIIVNGLRRAADVLGAGAVRSALHRLEHCELLTDEHISVLADLGVTASMQPMFDGLWGGPDGMYERRLGMARASSMNRFADIHRAGVLVAFGSDAPVTEMGPWQAIRAALEHSNEGQRISVRAAFTAHSRAGWRSVGDQESGVLAPGARAHYVVWDAAELAVQAPDDRVQRWSTDDRSGVPGLPILDADLPLPQARITVVAGRTVFEAA